ncbi:hypothetical protein GCM10009122_45310 [Fulvivirga kasyanovii]|uniref:DUF2335 domain-containing protein n=1 Tax=Fulvivirga kasyanovii TaxID=396812 RepID=A0ABW9RSI9_9BACT|nr:hypothetical protein [Fulvivirga kasyanovii]MTI27128.1 hypothetical protein [Fulvivirga kasyanovii]
MKIPSLFKTPRNQRFNIAPRYYDPVKEEIEQRTSRIKKELSLEERDDVIDENFYSSRIVGSFRHSRSKVKSTAGLTQGIIIMLLVGGGAGYLYFGNIALYIFLLVSSVLLYLKVKHII